MARWMCFSPVNAENTQPVNTALSRLGESVQNLPAGEFVLSVQDEKLTLAWMPKKLAKWGRVERVVQLK